MTITILTHLVIPLALILAITDTAYSSSIDQPTSEPRCYHSPDEPTVGVHIPSGSGEGIREKRDVPGYPSLRIVFDFHISILLELNDAQRDRLLNVVLPAAETYLESALSVRSPINGTILLDRDCSANSFIVPVGEVRKCSDECENVTMCGPLFAIPEQHLKRCVECDGSPDNCDTRPGSTDGSGVPNADVVVYIGATTSGGFCSGGTIAFAGACQLESTLDRPIAGHVNFCPNFFTLSVAENIQVALHELTHVLAFSSSLYRFYRDENGIPRTPRDENGFPPSAPSTSTVATVTYTDWLTRNGPIERNVNMLVTPNVIEQAKIHYGCDDIIGMELENQGGAGTIFSHWEHRIVGNEAMAGFLLFVGPFSRMTFGLFEDSGWYVPNYEFAQELAWGRNRGCSIPHGSCAEHIQNQQASQRTLSPFCNVLQNVGPPVRTCSVDRDLFTECSLIEFLLPEQVPLEFQYFNAGFNFGSDVAPRVGSSFTPTDYCPFASPFSIDIPASSCSNLMDAPGDNIAGETYGTGSRCIEHGQIWTRTLAGGQVNTYDIGVGCYQYSCSPLGVEIHLLGFRYLCSCEGEELLIDQDIDGIRYQGSFICPSCLTHCFDELDNCPDPEPNACPGQQTLAEPLPGNRVQCFLLYDSGSCSALLGPSISPFQCCVEDGGNAYRTSYGNCVQCPNNNNDVIEIAPERDTYSVLEGNDLEVCIIVLSQSIMIEFEVIADIYHKSYHIWTNITVEPGDLRSCGNLSIPDNLCLDKDKEYQIYFTVLSPPENTTIKFQRNTSWLFIVDNDILQIGFQQDVYEVYENASFVTVCIELLEGSACCRPVNVRLYTEDGNATVDEDYNSTLRILSLPVGSEVGDTVCTSIYIINDNETEELEYFSVHAVVVDLNVKVTRGEAIINIIDDDIPEFEIQFNSDTPLINDLIVLLSFSSTIPVDEATCSVVPRLGSVDCTGGSGLFTIVRRRRRREYTATITARAGDETRTIQRIFYSDTTGDCAVHLINEGLTIIDGQTAIIEVQGTGPSAADRITEFICQFPNEAAFPCGPSPILLEIPAGSSQLFIAPQAPDDGGICTRRRRVLTVQLDPEVQQ